MYIYTLNKHPENGAIDKKPQAHVRASFDNYCSSRLQPHSDYGGRDFHSHRYPNGNNYPHFKANREKKRDHRLIGGAKSNYGDIQRLGYVKSISSFLLGIDRIFFIHLIFIRQI